MPQFVIILIPVSSESLLTVLTLEGSLSCMFPHVNLEVPFLRKLFATALFRAYKESPAQMVSIQMHVQSRGSHIRSVAVWIWA